MLVAGKTIAGAIAAGWVSMTIPSVLDHEVLVIE
jgi:hypothetical protein